MSIDFRHLHISLLLLRPTGMQGEMNRGLSNSEIRQRFSAAKTRLQKQIRGQSIAIDSENDAVEYWMGSKTRSSSWEHGLS
jgi:hypothetical protein